MRRFEYHDDKSAKFWEVEQLEADLNIRWGRIGTAGQSQTKTFADAGKALAAMAKLVGEKTSKGYAEITNGVAAATVPAAVSSKAKATPVPKPAPKPVPGVPAGETTAAPTAAPAIAPASGPTPSPSASGVPPWLAQGEPLRLDNTHRLARATRRHPQPIKPVDVQGAWREARTLFATNIEVDFAGTDASLRDAFEAAWRSLDSDELGGTPYTDAILLALCLNRYRYGNNALDVKFVDYLVARHGLPYVIDTLLLAMSYAIDEQYVYPGDNIVRIHPRASQCRGHTDYRVLSEGQWRLRAHLAAAPQEIYDACAAKVKDGIEAACPECQVALALMFPDLPEMTHDVIGRLCADGVDTPRSAQWLQLTALDEVALAQVRKIRDDAFQRLCSEEDMVSTILLERGVEAVRWLGPGAEHDYAGDALTRIGTPDALDALARVASSGKTALARFTLAAQRWPAAAMFTLAHRLSGSSREQSLLTPTLLGLLHDHPELPAQLAPWLEPAANSLLGTLCTRLAGPTEVAPIEDLPEVLANVPWLQAKKKTAQTLQLPVLPLDPVEHWDAGEKEGVLKVSDWHKRHYREAASSPDALAEEFGFDRKHPTAEHQGYFKAARDAIAAADGPALIAAWRERMAAKKREGSRHYNYTFDGYAATLLPAQVGVPFWNAAASVSACYSIRFVFATWGWPAFPGVLARINATPSENLDIALHLGAVELGPIAARAFARLKPLRATGRQWLQRFPEHAACALIAPALGKPSEARDCAASALRYLASIGHTALLEQVAARYGKPEVLPALHAVLSESPLDRYPNKRAALPDFWKPSTWNRPLLRNGKALPASVLDTIGTMMMFPTTEEVYGGLPQLKGACTPESLADFAWDCFSAWLNAGAPNKDAWAMHSLGLLGTDDTARKLTRYIRTWPGEGAHARAVAGLDVLATIGSDVALMLLNGIAQKIKFKGLQDKAREKIDAVAEARGLSAEELEDRLAPDLGLDEHGGMVLDFGPRAFKVAFDEALKPYVREWQDANGTGAKAGARLTDLPKPKKTDDEQLAGQAVERFKLLKKDARTIASQQVLRLEVAMCTRRRWSPAVFAQFLASHPLVRHLVRRLVWGVYAMPVEVTGAGEDQERRVAGYGGELLSCFRVSEDGQYTSATDDPFSLPEGEEIKIGLPHALELTAEQIADFTQLLADYEMVQPFPQLGRDTYTLTDAERGADRLLRWKDLKVPTGKLLGLTNIGWRRGTAEDSGCICTVDKPADATRMLELTLDPGIIVGMVDERPEQTLGDVSIGGGSRWGTRSALPTFDTLDAIVASELIRDLERLR